MSTKHGFTGIVVLALATLADRADNDQRLPEPLERVAYDLGTLAQHFKIVSVKLHLPDSFTVGGRTVAEETIVWSLEAQESIKGADIYKMLHPGTAASPFPRVRFLKVVDGKEVSADARGMGYSLAREVRFINPKAAPNLDKGDRMDVWVHLGKEGTAGLIEQQASKMVVTLK